MQIDAEKKIENPFVSRLLRRVQRYVEDMMWRDGLVWYPKKARQQVSADLLASSILPPHGTPQSRAFLQKFSAYFGREVTSEQIYQWLQKEIDRRLWSYIIGARTKIDRIRLRVKARSVEIQAPRPTSTSPSVGQAAWNL